MSQSDKNFIENILNRLDKQYRDYEDDPFTEEEFLRVIAINPKLMVRKNRTDGVTLLEIAARGGYGNVCKTAIKANPAFLLRKAGNMKYMHLFAMKGIGKDILIKVLENKPRYAKIKDRNGRTFLHWAAYSRMNDVCLKALEVDPSLARIKNDDGETFLHWAADMPDVHMKALETDPSLATIKRNDGDTFLHLAAVCINNEVCMKALEMDPSLATIKNDAGRTFLHLAACKCMDDVCIKAMEIDPSLAKIEDNFGKTLLHEAAYRGMAKTYMKAMEIDPSLVDGCPKLRKRKPGDTQITMMGYAWLEDNIIKDEDCVVKEADPNEGRVKVGLMSRSSTVKAKKPATTIETSRTSLDDGKDIG